MSELYINVGTEKCCLFVKMSQFLIKRLDNFPLLFYAVEEALACAKAGYYGIGIIAFAQLLNQFNETTPAARHQVAHEFLRQKPSQRDFDEIVDRFKTSAAQRSEQECQDHGNADDYKQRIVHAWGVFMTKHRATQDSPHYAPKC